jgi:hypothetical protein
VKKEGQRWKAAPINVFRATGAEGAGLDDRLSFDGHESLHTLICLTSRRRDTSVVAITVADESLRITICMETI